MKLLLQKMEQYPLRNFYLGLRLLESSIGLKSQKVTECSADLKTLDSDAGLQEWRDRDPLIATFLNESKEQGFLLSDPDVLAGAQSLLWLEMSTITKVFAYPLKVTSTELKWGHCFKSLVVDVVANSGSEADKLHPISLLFLKTLQSHDKLCFISKNLDSHTIRLAVPLINQSDKGFLFLLQPFDSNGGTTNPPSHSEEHLDTKMMILQANIDNMNPEIMPFVSQKLFDAGANDVYLQPIQMKKNRGAMMINVLCQTHLVDELETILFRETTTLGVRRLNTQVHRLAREFKTIDSPWGALTLKIGKHGGQVVQIAPEYEACRKRAEEHEIPLKKIYNWVNGEIAKKKYWR